MFVVEGVQFLEHRCRHSSFLRSRTSVGLAPLEPSESAEHPEGVARPPGVGNVTNRSLSYGKLQRREA